MSRGAPKHRYRACDIDSSFGSRPDRRDVAAAQRRYVPLLTGVILIGLALVGCRGLEPRAEDYFPLPVEIRPGHFLVIQCAGQATAGFARFDTLWQVIHGTALDKYPEEWTVLKIPWKGGRLLHLSAGGPISLREYQNQMYLIVLDRSAGPGRNRLRYFKEDGMFMREIPYHEYPKQIAIQNMWWSSWDLKPTPDHRANVDLTIMADPDNRWFAKTLTASIWWHLSTGKNREQQQNDRPPQSVLREFNESYHPIRLTQIVPGRIPDYDWQPPEKEKEEE